MLCYLAYKAFLELKLRVNTPKTVEGKNILTCISSFFRDNYCLNNKAEKYWLILTENAFQRKTMNVLYLSNGSQCN